MAIAGATGERWHEVSLSVLADDYAAVDCCLHDKHVPERHRAMAALENRAQLPDRIEGGSQGFWQSMPAEGKGE